MLYYDNKHPASYHPSVVSKKVLFAIGQEQNASK